MKLQTDLIAGIERFLNLIPHNALRRGRQYFDKGAVLELECIEGNHLYAAVVRGGENYEVGLEFAGGEWMGECSCPVSVDCKHIVAALLELQQDLSGEGASVAQPPHSALCDKLTAHLGRPLKNDEAQFIRRVQASFGRACAGALTENDVWALAERQAGYNWQAAVFWPDVPPDDFHFWLWMARELVRRNWKYPQFMDGITDLSVIEPAIKAWEREKEVESWKNWFSKFDGDRTVSDPGVLDLRLAVLADEARLQWRTDAKSEFAEFKQAHAQKFSRQFEEGALALTAESLPLWSANYKPWNYQSWWSFRYSDVAGRLALSRLLRMGLAPDRVVAADGSAFPRVAEPLQLHLRAPENNDGDYELALTTADGSPPPKILCALEGRPFLYLTERGLFTGPTVHLPGAAGAGKRVPARALETADGLRFLHSAGVPLPERLARRVKTVPLTVTMECGVKMSYPGSKAEDMIVKITAKAPGMDKERFRLQGWEPERGNLFEKAAPKSRREDARISVFDRAAQRHFPRVLESLPDLRYRGYGDCWCLRMTKKTPELFVSWLKSLPPEIEVLLDKELATLRDGPLSGSVTLDVTEAGTDWFDLKVALDVSEATLTPEELKLLLNARGGYVRLGKKGWRRLQFNLTTEDEEQLARLGLDARDLSGEPQRFHALQLADEAAKRFLTQERFEKVQRRASELKTRVAPPLPPGIRAELRPYQTDGFYFLAYLTSNRFGGVLADDMGLGKTLQTLAWLAWLRGRADGAPAAGGENGGVSEGCSLVVCPKSVMDNWRAEAERFYPGLRVRQWRGEDAEELAGAREKADLIVINYAQLRGLSSEIAGGQWLAVILDEAQYIKNPDSQTAQAARGLRTEHRLALTGTPIENRLLDLWSILGFAMPGALGNRAYFLRRFNGKDDPLARQRLAARVRPFLLRRTKAQVAKDLPDRVEEDLFCEMEGEQKTLYRAELKRARQILLGLKSKQELDRERFNILTSLLRLRQICCHPALVDGKLRDAEGAKVSALEDLLEPLMEEGHKVLVFSQFVTMLDMLREKATEHGWPLFYLAGGTENRGELVEAFQSASGGAVFLISLKAGGFGLNLTAASYVVLFDPWWNPAVENQAIDRTHRIGQTSKVMAYRLLMRESIEEKIRMLQKQKAALADDVLGEERFAQSLTLDDLRFLFAD